MIVSCGKTRRFQEKVREVHPNQMERAVERFGGVGKNVSRYDAGSERVKKHKILKGMVEDNIRLQSNGKVLRADI